MTQLPNVSVIVPVYNAQETIRDCIDSLLELNYPKENLELIFVNNGSTDNTPEVLEQYSNDIRILHEAKRGPGRRQKQGDVECEVAKWSRLPIRIALSTKVGC